MTTMTYDMVNTERLLAEANMDTSELSQVLATLKVDSDRDVRYFIEHATSSLTASSDC